MITVDLTLRCLLNDTATTEIDTYGPTLSLHDAHPIYSSRATVSMPGWPGCNSTQRPPEAGSWTVDSFSRGNDLSQPSDIEPAVGTLFRREVRNRFHQF